MYFFDIFPVISFLLLIIMLVVKIIFLKKQGISVSSDVKKPKVIKFIIYPIFFLILILWCIEIYKPAINYSVSPLPFFLENRFINSKLLSISGIIITAFALVFMGFSLLHFKNSLRFGFDSTKRGKLITKGIFSVSRNPFFMSIEIYFLGINLLIPNLFFTVFTVSAIIGIHFFILKEEKHLQKFYGKEYKNYTKKVRRYF